MKREICHHWNIHTEISIDSEKSTASFYLVVLTTPILVMIENVQLGQIVNQVESQSDNYECKSTFYD